MRIGNFVSEDIARLGKPPTSFSLIVLLLRNRPFRVIFTYRLCRLFLGSQGLGRLPYYIFRLLHRVTQASINAELPVSCAVGPGLLIWHGYNTVINSGARIGSNVTILHGVTIGSTERGIPIIEDGVSIGASAVVIGPVIVGAGAVIGAGAVVVKDVPVASVVVGNPGRALVPKS